MERAKCLDNRMLFLFAFLLVFGTILIFRPLVSFGILTCLILHDFVRIRMANNCAYKSVQSELFPIEELGVMPPDYLNRNDQFVISFFSSLVNVVFAASCFTVFLLTGMEQIGLMVFIVAILNFVNLLPVFPTDGGKMCKSVFYSLGPEVGLVGQILGIGSTFYFLYLMPQKSVFIILPLVLVMFMDLRREVKAYNLFLKLITNQPESNYNENSLDPEEIQKFFYCYEGMGKRQSAICFFAYFFLLSTFFFLAIFSVQCVTLDEPMFGAISEVGAYILGSF